MNGDSYDLFCPACEAWLGADGACRQCGWERPQLGGALGEPVERPLTLGRIAGGLPVVTRRVAWYAAPPEERDTTGALLAIHRDGSQVRRLDLADLLPDSRLPVSSFLAGDDEALYVTCLDFGLGTERKPKALLALDPLTGEVTWRVDVPSVEVGPPARLGARLAATGAGPDRVYLFNLEQRRLEREFNLRAELRYRPVLTEQTIVVVRGTFMGPAHLAGLDARSGSERWSHEARAFSQPLIDPAGGLVITASGSLLQAYQADDGRKIWECNELRRTSQGLLTAPLTLAGSHLLVASGRHNPSHPYALYALDVTSGSISWRFDVPTERYGHLLTPPAVIGDTVVAGDRRGWLYAINLAGGELEWQVDLGVRAATAPYAEGPVLMAPTRDGKLHQLRREAAWRLDEAPTTYEARGAWRLAAAAYALASPPDWSAAGRCLLQAGAAWQAQRLFERGGNAAGVVEALGRQERFDEAVERAESSGLGAARAQWLRAAGRHGEAGETFEALEEWGEAGACYEQARKPVRAYQMYERAGDTTAQERILKTVDVSLLEARFGDILKKRPDWQLAAERFLAAGYVPAAADLYEQHQEWEQALKLRRQLKQWERVREICRELRRPLDEAQACEALAGQTSEPAQARQWWLAAAELYVQAQSWANAERCYQARDDPAGLAAVLAQQGRYQEAAEACTRPGERLPERAARYYEQAAWAHTDGIPQEQWASKQDMELAALWELAATWYRWAGQVDAMRRSRQMADRWRRRPRLELSDARISQPFQQGVVTQVHLRLSNVGAGPAEAINLAATGSARPEITYFRQIDALATAQQAEIEIGLKPMEAGQENAPLEFALTLSYRDVWNETACSDGPFQINEPVLPNYMPEATQGARTVNVFLSGSHFSYAGGDQVNIQQGRVTGQAISAEEAALAPALQAVRRRYVAQMEQGSIPGGAE